MSLAKAQVGTNLWAGLHPQVYQIQLEDQDSIASHPRHVRVVGDPTPSSREGNMDPVVGSGEASRNCSCQYDRDELKLQVDRHTHSICHELTFTYDIDKYDTNELLSLCAASQIWVRHRSDDIGNSSNGGWFGILGGTHEKILCFIHVTVKNSLGFTLQDFNGVMKHTRFLLLTRSTSVESCCLRIEIEARKIAECTSYTPCVLLSFSSPASLPYPSRHLAL